VYRSLRELAPDADATALQQALTGSGRYPRAPAACARLIGVLTELALIELTLDPPSCRVLHAERANLDSSPAYRTCVERLGAIERALGPELPDVARRAA
jgi:hypothetical protein